MWVLLMYDKLAGMILVVAMVVMVMVVAMMGLSERADRSLVCKITRSLRQTVCLHYTPPAVSGLPPKSSEDCSLWLTSADQDPRGVKSNN